MAKNENCVITDSSVCVWLNKSCAHCYVNSLKHDEDKEKVLSDFEVMLALIPDDFDTLASEDCQFCIGRTRPRAGYAIVDLAHNEPEHRKGIFFGIGKKVRQRIGSLLPVNISICSDCRRALRLVDIIKWASLIVLLGLGIGLMFVPSISAVIAKADSPLPYAIVIGAGVIGYFGGKFLSAAYLKSASKHTRFNVFEHPVCAKMQEGGWFTVQDEGAITRYVFGKKPFIGNIGELKKQIKKDEDEFAQTTFLKD